MIIIDIGGAGAVSAIRFETSNKGHPVFHISLHDDQVLNENENTQEKNTNS